MNFRGPGLSDVEHYTMQCQFDGTHGPAAAFQTDPLKLSTGLVRYQRTHIWTPTTSDRSTPQLPVPSQRRQALRWRSVDQTPPNTRIHLHGLSTSAHSGMYRTRLPASDSPPDPSLRPHTRTVVVRNADPEAKADKLSSSFIPSRGRSFSKPFSTVAQQMQLAPGSSTPPWIIIQILKKPEKDVISLRKMFDIQAGVHEPSHDWVSTFHKIEESHDISQKAERGRVEGHSRKDSLWQQDNCPAVSVNSRAASARQADVPPRMLPIHAVRGVLMKAFPATFEDMSDAHLVTAIEYFQSLEHDRRIVLNKAAARFNISEGKWREVVAGDNGDALCFVEAVAAVEDRIEELYMRLYIDLRLWSVVRILLVAKSSEKFVMLALLNTFYSPFAGGIPLTHALRPVLYEHRRILFDLVSEVDKSGDRSPVEKFMLEKLDSTSRRSYVKVRHNLTEYIRLTDGLIEKTMSLYHRQRVPKGLLLVKGGSTAAVMAPERCLVSLPTSRAHSILSQTSRRNLGGRTCPPTVFQVPPRSSSLVPCPVSRVRSIERAIYEMTGSDIEIGRRPDLIDIWHAPSKVRLIESNEELMGQTQGWQVKNAKSNGTATKRGPSWSIKPLPKIPNEEIAWNKSRTAHQRALLLNAESVATIRRKGFRAAVLKLLYGS